MQECFNFRIIYIFIYFTVASILSYKHGILFIEIKTHACIYIIYETNKIILDKGLSEYFLWKPALLFLKIKNRLTFAIYGAQELIKSAVK